MRARRTAVLVAGAVVVGAALLSARAGGGSLSGGSSSGSPPAVPPSETSGLRVLVVDEAGAPLAGVKLEGSSPVNPGPVASTCCSAKVFATAVTARDGRAIVGPVPLTFRPITIRATYRDWPVLESKGPGSWRAAPEELRLVLGPAREVRGKVRLDQACPASQLHVVVAAPWQEVAIDAEAASPSRRRRLGRTSRWSAATAAKTPPSRISKVAWWSWPYHPCRRSHPPGTDSLHELRIGEATRGPEAVALRTPSGRGGPVVPKRLVSQPAEPPLAG
jgi:hypothetical protein